MGLLQCNKIVPNRADAVPLADAAAIPIVYGTADLALRHRSQLQAGAGSERALGVCAGGLIVNSVKGPDFGLLHRLLLLVGQGETGRRKVLLLVLGRLGRGLQACHTSL